MIANSVVVNTRNLSAPLTGVQRYTTEILVRLPDRARSHSPRFPLRGLAGHLWEQCILPVTIGKSLLWSPSNTGPVLLNRHVVTIHDIAPIDHPEWVSPSFSRFYRWLTPRLARRARCVITGSAFIKQRLIELARISPDQVVIIPHGVGPDFRPRPPQELDTGLLRGSIGVGSYLLTVGSIVPRKNLARLLSAWLIARRRLKDDLALVVAGERGSPTIFSENQLPKDLPGVVWTGRVPSKDLPLLYAGAAGFAYVPLYEGFGLPVLEAMASGVPVLTSATTSLPEAAGDAALLVDPMSIDEIAEGLVRLAESATMAAELRARGLERARRYTWERAAAETWRVLEAAAG